MVDWVVIKDLQRIMFDWTVKRAVQKFALVPGIVDAVKAHLIDAPNIFILVAIFEKKGCRFASDIQSLRKERHYKLVKVVDINIPRWKLDERQLT